MPETVSLFGAQISLYYLFWFLGIIYALILGVLLAKDYGLTFAKAIVYVSVALVLGYLIIWITSWIFGGGKVQGFNLVRSVAFLPALYWALSRLFKKPYTEFSDFLAPVGVSGFGIIRIGCIFTGCCQGYPSHWGLYSNIAETKCFPIQPIEAAVSLIIGAILFVMAKKKIQQGKLLCWMMIMFGSTRFVLEFFRDNNKLFLNISELAIHALVTLIVGLIVLIVLTKQDNKRRANEKD